MERIEYKDYEEFAYNALDRMCSSGTFGSVSIIAGYNEAEEIIRELAGFNQPLVSIHLERPEWNGYYDEYVISLDLEGIWCEPMKRDGKYINDESEIVYILDNCSSSVIAQCTSHEVYEVSIGSGEGSKCDAEGTDDGECRCKKDTSILKESHRHDKASGCKYTVSVGEIDDLEKTIKDLASKVMLLQDMADECDRFRRLLHW